MKLIKFTDSTHSSEEAAKTLNCSLAQIIKTLVFHDKDYYFIVIMNGDSKLDYQRIKDLLGIRRPSMASPEKVIEITGYPVGGVMPIFETDLPVILDRKVLDFKIVYGGGGDSYTVSEITPDEIIETMKPRIESVSI